LLVLLLCAGSASADEIRRDASLLGFSDDGQRALIRQSADGPEGGGELSYVVVTTGGKHFARFVLSSDFSPGVGTPQRVSVAACKRAARKLATQLKGIPGARVQPAQCAKDRSSVVVVGAKIGTVPTQTLAEAGLSLRTAGDKLEVVLGGKAVTSFVTRWPPEVPGRVGPGGHLVLVLGAGGFQALVSVSGQLAELTPIHPPLAL
jgi:hypothetical protein